MCGSSRRKFRENASSRLDAGDNLITSGVEKVEVQNAFPISVFTSKVQISVCIDIAL